MLELWEAGPWILQTLRTITSNRFNEFVIWVSDVRIPLFLGYPLLSDDRWGGVDALLDVLADRNPDFRVVFRGDINLFHCSEGHRDDAGTLVEAHLPYFSSRGLVKFEQAPRVEKGARKLGIL